MVVFIFFLQHIVTITSKFIRAYYFVFEAMNTIFHYDLVLISLNNKIIVHIF